MGIELIPHAPNLEITMLSIEQELEATAACVEIFKGLAPTSRPRVARRLYEEFGEVLPATLNGNPSNIGSLVESDEFQSLHTAQERYLALLRHISESLPSKFAQAAPTVRGDKRRYLAKTEKEITDSGTSTKPAEISPGGWWADLNNSTTNKKTNLRKVMQLMGYGRTDCDLACKAIR
jgi:negative regulator of replication initiation